MIIFQVICIGSGFLGYLICICNCIREIVFQTSIDMFHTFFVAPGIDFTATADFIFFFRATYNECHLYVVGTIFKSIRRRCSVKNVFLEILQNSQVNTCARVSFLIKLQAKYF